MKFGSVFGSNKDKDKVKEQRRTERRETVNGEQNGKVATEEKLHAKSSDVPITAVPVRPASSHQPLKSPKSPELAQRRPDPNVPGYVSLAQQKQQQQQQQYQHAQSPQQSQSPEGPWSSRFSDSTRSGYHAASANTIEDPPPLQFLANDDAHLRGLSPLPEEAVDPDGFDLTAPPRSDWETPELEPLERRSLLMFSRTHLRIVFNDLKLLRRFSVFLMEHRPEHVPLLVYHLDVRKALAAIEYTNAVTRCLKPTEGPGLEFTKEMVAVTGNEELVAKAEESFKVLADEDLPAWITSVWMGAVEVSIRRRINGSLPTQLRDMSEGLAETFCLSDPARHDNPILFASEEFNRMTQYSNKYVIGRNCRIFQGPQTNPHGVRRIREKLNNAEQHYEPCLNYRRDGSPFMNLLMITPLLDNNGKVRYYLGAQIDTSGLLNDFYGFEHLHQYVNKPGYEVVDKNGGECGPMITPDTGRKHGELQTLSELYNHDELDVIRKHGGRLHHPDLQEPASTWKKRQRLVIPTDGDSQQNYDGAHDGALMDGSTPWDEHDTQPGDLPKSRGINGYTNGNGSNNPTQNHIMSPGTDPSFLSTSEHSAGASFDAHHGGQLGGVYEHYLLVRPAPYLRILFASPSLRIPGMVQSGLMERIGGSAQLRGQIEAALTHGQSVTARVKWIANPKKGGAATARNRWLHATPLLGRHGEVGVWMVVLVDDEQRLGAGLVGGVGRGPRSDTSAGTSVRGSRGPSVGERERKDSMGFNGTDAGSILEQEVDVRRESLQDGLRPPPSARGHRPQYTFDQDGPGHAL